MTGSLGRGRRALAGDVNITLSDTLLMENSTLTTTATVADGGNITIRPTGSLLLLKDSQSTTAVQSGTGAGGNITLGSSLHPGRPRLQASLAGGRPAVGSAEEPGAVGVTSFVNEIERGAARAPE
jgi:hypothetical protein